MASPALGVRFERTMDYRAAGTSLTTSQVGHLAMVMILNYTQLS